MSTYLHSQGGTRRTPQNRAVPGSSQAENSAGGFAWQVDHWTRLRRFLVIGSEGGSYYASERALTTENVTAITDCLADDGQRTVREIIAVSEAGRAPKNDPAIYALAMCCAADDDATRSAALSAIPQVCRTGTHLFHFAAFVEQFRGWGRGLRRAVGDWYQREDLEAVAYQAVKYRQRDGWTHRDLLRLAHPTPADPRRDALYRWITSGQFDIEASTEIVEAYERAQQATTPEQTADVLRRYPSLPREALNTDHLTDPKVWAVMLDNGMPMTALIRNLPTLTRLGLIAPMGAYTKQVCDQLTNADKIRKARVHPLQVLVALRTYSSGVSARGSQTWDAVGPVVDALDGAFDLSFGNVTPTGKRTMLALDVSGSMGWNDIAGMPGITPRIGSAAMAMLAARTESQYMVTAFATQFSSLPITGRQRLDDVLNIVDGLPMGGTDCSLPMLAALGSKVDVDLFVIYTDSETWAGRVHPSQALREYREKTGINAKLVVVGMVSNGFSIADPNDPGMLDVVGFDTASPNVIAEFAGM